MATQLKSKTHAHVVIDRDLWKKVKKLAVDANVSASDLVELSLQTLLAIIESGRCDCGALEKVARVAGREG